MRIPARWERAGVLALAGLALALALAFPTYPNYDAYYHLVWGRELLDGQAPGFEAYQAPTQHPLYLALAALLSLLGDGADRALVLLCVGAMVALAWGAFRLGQEVFGAWPGVAGAALVASSFAFLLYAVRAYVDVPFLALVVWAAALAARGDRRSPLVLLALAGLLRPEAWVLAGALALWRPWPGRGGRLTGLIVAGTAPVVWAAVDAAVTGDPLHSLHATSDLADELRRRRGVEDLPVSFVEYLADTLRPPVAALALVGVVLAWRRLGPERLWVPLGLVGAGALTFLLTGLAGLSILPRYLTVPAVALSLFAGYALMGFTTLPAGRARDRWRWAAVAAAVVGLVGFAALRAPVVERLFDELRFVRATHDDLVGVLEDPAVRQRRGCGPITLPTYRLVPDARWALDAPPERVGARSARRRPYGVALFPIGRKALDRFGFAQGTSPRVNVPDPGYRPLVRRPHFTAYGRCPPGHPLARSPGAPSARPGPRAGPTAAR